MPQELLERIEIWKPVKTGGEMIKADGTHLERIATIINGHIIFLKENYAIEKCSISKEEVKQIYKN